VPTPLPPVVHAAKQRPPTIGPVWRYAPVVAISDVSVYVDVKHVVAEPVPVAAVSAPEAMPKPPAPAVIVAVANVAPVVEPPKPKPVPVVVVAEKAPEPAPAPAKPTAEVAAAPAVAEPAGSGTQWFDYVGIFALATIIGGAILFFNRERQTV
jgi:hypothetical protein